MVCYEGNEDGFWLLWIVAAVGFCAFAIFVPAVLAEILYKANCPAPAAAEPSACVAQGKRGRAAGLEPPSGAHSAGSLH